MPPKAKEFHGKNRKEWRSWLRSNHRIENSVWLVYDKGKDRTLSYEEIVEEALCFGWIDSVPGKIDDKKAKIYVSKRKPKSAWSKANKARVEALTRSRLMTKSGLAAVEAAKQNGSWDALTRSDSLQMPEQLESRLSADQKARKFFDAMPPSSKKIILEWIYAAKTESTKMNRIKETADLAAKGIKAHHYRQ